jgi:hypothetical protein
MELNETGGTLFMPEMLKAHLDVLRSEADKVQQQADIEDILEKVHKARVDPNALIAAAPMIASIQETCIATLGNFSAIIGKAKSKKTFFITLVVGTFLIEKIGPLQTYGAHGKKRIVWFDTEQSRYHFTKAFRRALELSKGENFYNIEAYGLRGESPTDRLRIMDYVLRDLNENQDIAFVVIDGIRDLVMDINDPKEATAIITWLMKVTEEMNLHICTIIHQNKGDNNARGHLGTEIINKAETVISIQKDSDNISSVWPEFCREIDFKPFAFTVNESSLPQILEGYTPERNEQNNRRRTKSQAASSDELQIKLMAKVFATKECLGYSELVSEVISHGYSVFGNTFGSNIAKGLITDCTAKRIIINSGKDGNKSKYIFNQNRELFHPLPSS